MATMYGNNFRRSAQETVSEAPKDTVGAREWLADLLAEEAKIPASADESEALGSPSASRHREGLMMAAAWAGNQALLLAMMQTTAAGWGQEEGASAQAVAERERRHDLALLTAVEADWMQIAALLSEKIDFAKWSQRREEDEPKDALEWILAFPLRTQGAEAWIAKVASRVAQTTSLSAREWNGVAAKAAELDDIPLLEMALAAGVDAMGEFRPTAANRYSGARALLCLAAGAGADRVVELLLAMGADPLDGGAENCSPLMWTAVSTGIYQFGCAGALPCAKILASLSDADKQSNDGGTALMWAAGGAGSKNVELIRFLAARSNPNLRDNEGENALMKLIAAGVDDRGVMDGVLEAIEIIAPLTDPETRNAEGKTALDFALEQAGVGATRRIESDVDGWPIVNALFAAMTPSQAAAGMQTLMRAIVPDAEPKLEAHTLERVMSQAASDARARVQVQENDGPNEKAEEATASGKRKARARL